ncbi:MULTISPECIES: tRNA (N(6)-L-threonylcarbamoyladenosine(37)-C(2))-methylthiotransferase MtaB [Brevibacillus]|jgi:threonylcarbamoyladenosine tRNA methylthiotransferase MtaB|uniref:tRNA (N(6)-L-threonylcarbamoyladenosine(37)-C(2))- methylthiotransferase MtaB n=1 Tax=Brevibacillus TaxID=55080 RepID=UPI0004F2718B|nr:tRNA (N(6)-L-threonylcarbamoyladenosine(37)-C(2))-methylthiotransferase MtaB [Brevibacillus borstelensis]KKX55928.1 30S ribosomal protein S12 methylthiotransferase [Brevibacillus borstelensis cifa_chp40]MBE5396751.1 tRNA (N(6)-L-threonylcarbamoyladenosine(37)-C(2))-methylthiotransferase MtaB [Brevibacillus borstelensis]MCM3623886.1 tRNA (N(6)-L-threonylcarbamoyladenosine(37)-C(2))-methylthiotransferase MtaB [Brevibacillus borstelensis]MED1743312.1 tRNA (N(6)-L-threonylcarbamoyladenosine(37)-
MSTVAFHTLGCKVNSYETEAIWQLFKNSGYERVDFEQDEADVYVINTCTVTNTGDKKSRQVIRRAIRRNPDAIVAVTGCYAQTSPSEIAQIPGVDIIVGTQGREKLIEYVDQIRSERKPINAVANIMKAREFEELDVPNFTDRTRASLKIQEGCNNFCTFCIIPWARGLMRSRKPESVLEQARQLVAAGYLEIVLTGIHTGGYGEDLEDYNLAKLLVDLHQVEGLKRIRISSIEASQITDEVIDVINHSDRVVRHLHVPLQAGDDDVLKRMRRKYTTAEFYEKMVKVREALPGVALTTDVIVGFPGETDEQFRNGYEFIQKIGFAELHVFPYSMRTGTPAARMTDQIPEEIKHERVTQLLGLNRELTLQYAQQFVGEVLEVIPERPYKEAPESGLLMGYSDNYLNLVFPGDESMIGKICKVRLDEAGSEYCKGTFVRVLDTPIPMQLKEHVG